MPQIHCKTNRTLQGGIKSSKANEQKSNDIHLNLTNNSSTPKQKSFIIRKGNLWSSESKRNSNLSTPSGGTTRESETSHTAEKREEDEDFEKQGNMLMNSNEEEKADVSKLGKLKAEISLRGLLKEKSYDFSPVGSEASDEQMKSRKQFISEWKEFQFEVKMGEFLGEGENNLCSYLTFLRSLWESLQGIKCRDWTICSCEAFGAWRSKR